MPGADRLIVALDTADVAAARRLIAALDGVVSFFKVGLQLGLARGAEGLIDEINDAGKQVFLDYKFYDIGETVSRAVTQAVDRGVRFLTVHAVPQVMEAAVRARGEADVKILAVTVLTSLDESDLRAMGHTGAPADLVRLRADQALAAGCDGVIASGQEASAIRGLAGDRPFLVVSPGVRPAGVSRNDQKRVMTPAAAIAAGADYLVVGRPISAADDPRAAAAAISAEIGAAFADRI